jgi:ribonuclease P protein component
MIGRIQRSVDFEKVLATAPYARGGGFALHHLPLAPSKPGAAKVSTSCTHFFGAERETVDKSVDSPSVGPVSIAFAAPTQAYLGQVVPKRFAPRSVTRALVKRLVRSVFERVHLSLPPGMWVLRLRSPIDRKQFPSARSEALRVLLREQIELTFARALKGPAPAAKPGGNGRAQGLSAPEPLPPEPARAS